MEAFMGMISAFGFIYAPEDWAYCNGAAVKLSDNESLYSLLGVAYGGDGKTYFNLPNLTSRVAVGYYSGGQRPVGLDTYRLGQSGGAEFATMTTAQMPPHTHAFEFSYAGDNNNAVRGSLKATTAPAGNQTPEDGFHLAEARSSATGNPSGSLVYTSDTSGTRVKLADVSLSGSGVGLTGGTLTLDKTGSATPIYTQGPGLAINYQIAMQGIYPSRG